MKHSGGIMTSNKADEIDEIAQRIILKLESASSKELSDLHYAKKILYLSDINYAKTILQQIDSAHSAQVESEIEKRAVIKVLLLSTWSQRLYFIIRSFIMGELGTVITFLFILSFGSIDVYMGFVMGAIVFVASLVISRLFDVQIVKVTKKIIARLASHRTVRDFIMNHF
jgi:hypothetical protein